MFEDSLFASRVGVVSATKRWTVAASAVQMALAALVITLPLVHPEGLPVHVDAPKVQMPLLPKPPVPVVVTERASSSAATRVELPSQTRRFVFPTIAGPLTAAGDAPALHPFGGGMGVPDGLPAGMGIGDAHGPSVTVAPVRAAKPIPVSTGVMQGRLLVPIRPVYPAIAQAAHIEGTVVVEAVISRAGLVESLHVVSGPQMLQNAALEAIRGARYQPYRLNGEPTDVQTTITVNFRIGG